MKPYRTRFLAGVIGLSLLVGSGCAYFNTLYNAKQKYREALDIKAGADPERENITPQEEKLYEESFDKAARVVKHYPDSKWVDDALLLMAKASHEKSDYSAALRKYDELLTHFPDSDLIPETFLMQGRTLIEVREYDRAVTALARAAEEDQKEFRGDVIFLRGLVEERRGNPDEALASYVEVLERHKGSDYFGEAGIRAGDLSLESGDAAGAVNFYEKVRAKGHTPLEKYRGGMKKGGALLELEEWDRARKTFSDVADRTANVEDRGRARLMAAAAVGSSGDTERAIDMYTEILERRERSEEAAEARYAIAAFYDDAGDLETALTQYETVKEAGTSFDASRRAAERIAEIQRVLDLRKEIEEAEDADEERRKRFLLAEQLLEKIGDTEAAVTEYEALAEEAPDTEWGSRATFARAWVLEHRLDQPDSASALLFQLANRDTRTEVAAEARRRHGMPVWTFEELETPRVVFIRPEGQDVPQEAVVSAVEPRQVPLPPGMTEVEVWVRVSVEGDGRVKSAKAVKSSAGDDHPEFEEAALEAAQASTFLSPDEGGPSITVIQYYFPPRVANTDNPLDDGEPSAAERDAALDALDANDANNANATLPPGVEAPAADAPPAAAITDTARSGFRPATPPRNLRDRRLGQDDD